MENNSTKKSKKMIVEPWWISSLNEAGRKIIELQQEEVDDRAPIAKEKQIQREREIQIKREEEKQRQERKKKLEAAAVPVIKASTEKKKLTLFRNKNDVLQAIVMKEILDPPKSIQ